MKKNIFLITLGLSLLLAASCGIDKRATHATSSTLTSLISKSGATIATCGNYCGNWLGNFYSVETTLIFQTDGIVLFNSSTGTKSERLLIKNGTYYVTDTAHNQLLTLVDYSANINLTTTSGDVYSFIKN